jgi:hypothetical protein
LNSIPIQQLFNKKITLLFSQTDTPPEIWQAIKHELHRGALDPKHPFRYVNLATRGKDFPQVRTVVLRELTQEFDFLVFTDHRTAKVKEIQESSAVSLHFYHPKKMLQIRVEAEAEINFQNGLSDQYWKKIPDHRKVEYTGALAPGEVIEHPEKGWEISEYSFFTVLKISALRIEGLQITKKGHLKIRFESQNNWQGKWLVP